MIDHNPEYDQGFRDATSNEIRQFREDENYRYRDMQTRMGQDEAVMRRDKNATVSKEYVKKHAIEGVRLANRTPTEVKVEEIAGVVFPLLLLLTIIVVVKYLL